MQNFFFLFSLSLPLVLFTVPSFAGKSAVYEKASFKPSYDSAVGNIYKNHEGGRLTDASGGKVTSVEIPNLSEGGAWRVGLGIACALEGTENPTSNEYGKVMTYNSPGAVINNRGDFAYLFQTQVVDDFYVETVEKELISRRKTIAKELKDVSVTLERQPDKTYRLLASYSYSGGVTPSQVTDRLTDLFQQSEWLLCDVHKGILNANKESWKRNKGSITQLSKPEFVVLYPLFQQGGFEVNNPQNPHGQWTLAGQGYGVWVENLNTQMKLWIRIPQPKGNVSETQVSAVLARLQEIKPYKTSGSVEVSWDANDIWVGSTYPYADIKGKDIEGLIDAFWGKYAPDVTKDAQKIVKKML